ncbi:MAG: dTDP-4-dehydrorhamnose 3,5-epimerase [Pseudomonadales bacterium]|nr:dTDP-4-dehydrorhamnose 3,5-epimerase [Pseudomonadales bacterium]
MKFTPSKIPDVVIIEPKVFGDQRGFFMETWSTRDFSEAGLDLNFVQDNHSGSTQGILRGLHYQIQNPQGKLVRVVRGEVYDVAVDMRRSSPTYGEWVGVTLSEQNRRMLWVPPGFAHGFYVTSAEAEFVYKCTDLYAPEHERSLLWNDPDLGIDWLIAADALPTLSEKDVNGTPFKQADSYP